MVRGKEWRKYFAKQLVKRMTTLSSLLSLLGAIITLVLGEDLLIATILLGFGLLFGLLRFVHDA